MPDLGQKKPDEPQGIIGIKGQYLQKCHIQEGALKLRFHGNEKGKEAKKPTVLNTAETKYREK